MESSSDSCEVAVKSRQDAKHRDGVDDEKCLDLTRTPNAPRPAPPGPVSPRALNLNAMWQFSTH
jgi:hypothetical protein